MKIFKFICVYGGPVNSSLSISPLDGSPGYLHVHALSPDLLERTNVVTNCQYAEDGVLYQWGTPEDMMLGNRKPVISEFQRKSFGALGIGSAASILKESGEFVGAGEGFIYGAQAFRVTRGNCAFPMNEDDGYWVLQTIAFRNTVKISKIRRIVSRLNFIEQVRSALNIDDRPFVATFNAWADERVFFRSNGVLPTDTVLNKDITCFPSSIAMGGHMLGNSDEPGDIASRAPQNAEVILLVDGLVEVELVNQIRIAEKDNPAKFRSPRYKA